MMALFERMCEHLYNKYWYYVYSDGGCEGDVESRRILLLMKSEDDGIILRKATSTKILGKK